MLQPTPTRDQIRNKIAAAPIRLIVNADDFGLTLGVNRAVAELVSASALSSATLMANSNGFAEAVERAAANPSLGVGCHVVLVDGEPVLPTASVPTLLEPGSGNHFHTSLLRFAMDLQRGKISEKEIEAEAVAQISRLQAAGLRVTHVDTHKHTHLFPRVARPLLRAAVRCGVPAIRNPFEPAWSARLPRGAATSGILLRQLEVTVLRRRYEGSFHQLRRAAGLRTTNGAIGVSATGRLDAKTLERLLAHAPAGTWELVCHPGYNDRALDAIKTRLRGTRDVEREALLKLIPEAIRSGRVELIRFSDLS
jgi:predicted glycoside hydrolase/deacetylase ChbG (UPF0249 family)